ncbi:DUF6089 family protein [Adhaeribacter aquaticus]|uniref:type IX secretion system protein PorG n=1 Tax=Adhaeribacter aquaticus TaxID=299567 RepID=UPI00054CE0B9|nr:DUF6089 family protein [Adhaeribacter aquaticus]
MKKIKLVMMLLVCLQIGSFSFLEAFAQKTSEVGLGIGGANYKGEISPNYRFLNNRPALTVFYKKDISKAVVARAGILFGQTRAKDINVDLPVNQFRQADMRTNLGELAIGIDYNFLDYYDMKRRVRWTPYFFTGAALANYNNKVVFNNDLIKPFENGFILGIPMGVGVKYALSYHWNLGLEVAARKTVLKGGDKFDYLKTKEYSPNPPQNLQFANPYDKDWYFYNGISISYTFYKIVCPDVYKKDPKLLRR